MLFDFPKTNSTAVLVTQHVKFWLNQCEFWEGQEQEQALALGID